MRYSVIACVNSNFFVKTEHSDLQSAIISFHGICRTFWNASDVATATVKIMDENLDNVQGYSDFITHEVVATVTPTETDTATEPTTETTTEDTTEDTTATEETTTEETTETTTEEETTEAE